MSLVRAAVSVGLLTFISRMFGYVRDIFIAAQLGAGPIADAFLVAFRLPNFFRRLFAEGAFSSAFVPLYAGTLAGEGESAAKLFADRVFTLLTVIVLFFVILMQIGMPWVVKGIAPGFSDDVVQMTLCTTLTRITMFYLFFISLVSLLSGILNSVGRFAAAAASPILLNACMVTAIAYFARYTETPAHALSWGVMVAGVVQFLALCWSCKRAGVMPKLCIPVRDSHVRLLFKNMVPGILGVGVVQINLWVDTIIATYVGDGAVSLLYYADRITQLPLALIGTAIGTVLLPTLSKHMREGRKEEAHTTQNRAIEAALLLTLPCTIALLAIALPIMSVLFERGEFTHKEAVGSANALMAFALGLPAFVMIKLLTPGFFALRDTRTPTIIAVSCLLSNILFNLALMRILAHVGIALATSLSAWMNVGLLLYISLRRGIFHTDLQLRTRAPRILLASFVMAATLFLVNTGVANLLAHEGTLMRFVGLSLLIGSGLVSFSAAVLVLRAFTIGEVKALFKRAPKSATPISENV